MRTCGWRRFVLIAIAGLWFAVMGGLPAALVPVWATELRGESRLLLEVDRQQLIEASCFALRGEVRERLRTSRIGYNGLVARDGIVELRITHATDIARAKALLADLLSPAAGQQADTPGEWSLAEPEPGWLRYRPSGVAIDRRESAAAEKSAKIFSRRLDELGLWEADIERRGNNGIEVVVTGLHDPATLRDLLTVRGQLTLRWVVGPADSAAPPDGASVLYSFDEIPLPYFIEDAVILGGDSIASAQARIDQDTGKSILVFTFNPQGTRIFAEATEQNVGRRLALVLDDVVMSVPVLREPIENGYLQISGGLSLLVARNLALLVRTGALPVQLNPVEVRFRLVDP
jgi:protein-export membrane protein SecD